MPPRDPRGLLAFLLEALGDPDSPDVLKDDIRRYLDGPAGLSRVVEAIDWADKDEAFASLVERAEPIVMAKRSEAMLKAFASVMSARTTLRQALTFVMTARGELKFGYIRKSLSEDDRKKVRQGYLITEIQERAGQDSNGDDLIGTSITNTTAALGDLIQVTVDPDDGRKRPVRLTPAGSKLMADALSRLRLPG